MITNLKWLWGDLSVRSQQQTSSYHIAVKSYNQPNDADKPSLINGVGSAASQIIKWDSE